MALKEPTLKKSSVSGNGERAARRDHELRHPAGETPLYMNSVKPARKLAHHIERRYGKQEIKNGLADFLDGPDVPVTLTTVVETPSEAMLREARRNSWMYRKVATHRLSVTVTSGRIIFH